MIDIGPILDWRACEQFEAGTFHPVTVDGGRFGGGNLPEGHESPEVVDPHHVEPGKGGPEPVRPPLVELRAMRLPVVQRIAPSLPGRREVVGRHPGDHGRAAV